MKSIFYQAPFITKANHRRIILLVLMLTSAACNKNIEESSHRDVFQCEINGVPWEAGCDSQNLLWSCDYMDCIYYPANGSFTLLASNNLLKYGFRIRKTTSDGGLKLGENKISSIQFGRSDTLANECTLFNIFDTSSILTILEFNTSDKTINGKIEHIDLFSSCMDSVIVSKVDFKVKYRP